MTLKYYKEGISSIYTRVWLRPLQSFDPSRPKQANTGCMKYRLGEQGSTENSKLLLDHLRFYARGETNEEVSIKNQEPSPSTWIWMR